MMHGDGAIMYSNGESYAGGWKNNLPEDVQAMQELHTLYPAATINYL